MANYKILSSLLLLTVLVQSYYAVQINTATFSERIRAIMDENLGVSRMQVGFVNTPTHITTNICILGTF